MIESQFSSVQLYPYINVNSLLLPHGCFPNVSIHTDLHSRVTCLGYQPFVITDFITFCDWFHQLRVGPRGWWVTFPTLLILGRLLSAQLGCLFHEVRFIAVMLYGMRLLSSDFMYFMLPNSAFCFKKTFVFLFFLRLFIYFCYWCFVRSWNQIGILYWKWIWCLWWFNQSQLIMNIGARHYRYVR